MTSVIQASDIENAIDVDTTTEQQRKADEIADGLTALAGLVRDNPDLFAPWHRNGYPFGELLGFIGNGHGYDKDQRATLAQFARAAARAGVTVAKETAGTGDRMFGVRIKFAGGVALRVLGDRDEICERVVTGTETVTREVPDPEALAAVPTVTVTEQVETVEWRCGPLLGDQPAGADR